MRESRIALTKMHGAHNDFVIVDCRRVPIGDAPSFARWVCDRRDGVGADGLLTLERATHGDVRMRIFNADGSEAEMCGNGIRCAARWLDEAGEGERVRFETLAGTVETVVEGREPEYRVRVRLGVPTLDRDRLPGATRATVVDLGNPHVVIFRDRLDDLDLTRLAEGMQRDARFPEGANVHIAVLERDGIRARHWERGVGLTQACGTGAVAVAAVAISDGVVAEAVQVAVPGGQLGVEWDGRGPAYLIGPAVRVFDAAVDRPLAAAH